MGIVFPILLLLLVVVIVAVRQTFGLWTNLLMLGNMIVAALMATNYFELLAGWLTDKVSMLAYYADFIAIWVLFGGTLMLFKTLTDYMSRYRVRLPEVVEMGGNYLAMLTIGWVLICFTAMTMHLAPLGREAFDGGFKPDAPCFFGISPDHLWLGFAQRTSQGALAGSHIFDANGEFLPHYAARREHFDRNE